MLAVYIGFILLIAFAPGWLGTPLNPNTSVTRGIPIGVGVIVISFVLTGIYIWRANGEFGLAGHPAESEHQRHTRYSNWCWSDCDLLCSHRYLHLAGERRIRPS